jgi:hypothetical protein
MRFAENWDKTKVHECLRQGEPGQLADFILARHEERFLQPVRLMRAAPGNAQGYGFAMMALCLLLVETIQSYRDGLPTTDKREFDKLVVLANIPQPYRLKKSDWKSGKRAFQRFFRASRGPFEGLPGAAFYKNVRCGLLHQGQTKKGWIIERKGFKAWNRTTSSRILYRNDFFAALENCFRKYLDDLQASGRQDRIFKLAARKVWWLVRLS